MAAAQATAVVIALTLAFISGGFFGAAFALHPMTRPVPLRPDTNELAALCLVLSLVFAGFAAATWR